MLLAFSLALLLAPTADPPAQPSLPAACSSERIVNPAVVLNERQLRCEYGAWGPGRFGLLSYADVPVYQPDTPMPGTHVVGVPGHARPAPGESYEAWEWRMLRTRFGPEAHRVHRAVHLLHPTAAALVVTLEQRLDAAGVRAVRRESWRSPERQAFLFQQGRSRPGPLATATLTSWHSHVDSLGRPAGRAVDYEVPARHMRRFHEIARSVGLDSFGADSHDPGHVFLPDPVDTGELVRLRVLRRVPHVTLATGLPEDQPLPAGGRALVRARAAEFADAPFVPVHTPWLAQAPPAAHVLQRLHDAARLAAQAARCPVSGRRGRRSDGDGGRCAPRRSAGHAPG